MSVIGHSAKRVWEGGVSQAPRPGEMAVLWKIGQREPERWRRAGGGQLHRNWWRDRVSAMVLTEWVRGEAGKLAK